MATTEENTILKITLDYEDAVYGILRYKEKIQELKDMQKEMQDQVKAGTLTQEEYAKQLVASNAQIKSYSDEMRGLNKELQNNLKIEKANNEEREDSMVSLRAQLSNLTKAYDNLSKAQRNGAEGKALAASINQVTTELKTAEAETQRYYRNVGNYQQSIIAAIGGNNQFAQSLGKFAGGGGIAALAAAGIAGVTTAIVALKNAVSSGIKLIIDFEKQNSKLAAVMGTTATQTNELRVAALKLGETTRYTASEVAGLQIELAKLGFTQKEIIDAEAAILQFANATDAGLAEAASVAGAALRAFGDDASNMDRYVSAMAVATTKSALSFADLSTTISTLAPVAKAFGFEIEDVVTLVGKLKDAGFDASSAATATRNILLNLADANGALAKSLGAPVKNMQDLQDGLILLRNANIDLATALDLTDKRSVAAFEAFMTGADKLVELRSSVTNVTDELASMDEEMQNNVQGSTLKLQSAWEGLLLKFYSSKGIIKSLIDWLTSVVQWCSTLGDRFQNLYDRSILLRAAWESLVLNIKVLTSTISTALKLFMTQVKMAGQALEALFTLDFKKLWQTFKTGFSSQIDILSTQGKNVADAYVNAFSKTFNGRKKDLDVSEETANVMDKTEKKIEQKAANIQTKADKKAAERAKREAERAKREADKRAEVERNAIAEAEKLLYEVIEDNAEKRRKQIEANYNKETAAILAKLKDKAKLTEKAEKALNEALRLLNEKRKKELNELEISISEQSIKNEQNRISLLLSSLEKDYLKRRELKLQQIDNEEKLEQQRIIKSVSNEEQRSELLLALQIAQKKKRIDVEKEFEGNLEKERLASINRDYEASMFAARDNELEQLRITLEMRQQLLQEAEQREGETQEEWNARRLQLEKNAYDAEKELDEKRFEMKKANAEAIAGLMGTLSDAFGELGESNKAFAKLSKVLALGEIAVNTGVALAAGIKQAQSVPFPANIAAVATTVATILANIATAIKTVNSAKFAEGGLVTGAGTGTSDSITARVSNGESIMTANSTAMFAPLLSSLNQLGGGVPIVPQASPSQQIGEEFLAAAVARGMEYAPRPVVSVEEIHRVSDRVEVIENISQV